MLAIHLQVLTKCSLERLLIQETTDTKRRHLNSYFVNTSPHPLDPHQARFE